MGIIGISDGYNNVIKIGVDIPSREEVMVDTWGHLAPKLDGRKRYEGQMIFLWSPYGDVVLFDANFKGLEDSPWLYNDMMDFVHSHVKEGKILKFIGTYQKFKDGGYQFHGNIKEIPT